MGSVMYPKGVSPLRGCVFSDGYLLKQNAVYRQAAPLEYHGTCQEFLETFKGLGIIPTNCLLPQKKMLAGIIHLNFCNNIFAEKHIVGSSEPAIIFSNVRMDCSTKTSEFKQKEAALTFTLSSS